MDKSTINHYKFVASIPVLIANPSQFQPIPGAPGAPGGAGAPGGPFCAGEFAQLRAGGAGRVGAWESLDLGQSYMDTN